MKSALKVWLVRRPNFRTAVPSPQNPVRFKSDRRCDPPLQYMLEDLVASLMARALTLNGQMLNGQCGRNQSF